MTVDEKLNPHHPVSVSDEELVTQTLYRSVSRVISTPADISTADQMNVVEVSGTVSFWDDDAEDVYSPDDGDAI